jgi:predicted alpha-1,2-mannosidase
VTGDPLVLTLDAGGTTFELCAIRGGRPAIDRRVIAAPTRGLESCLDTIRAGLADVARCAGPPAAISIAFPGPADYPRGVIGDLGNLPCFRGGVALGPMLEDAFGVPVFINNDGDLFALGEATAGLLPWLDARLAAAGSSRRYHNLIGVTIGTGFGGGIVSNGRLLAGDNAAAGEIWLVRHKHARDLPAEEGVSIRAVRRVYAGLAGIDEVDAPTPAVIAAIADGRVDGNPAAARAAYAMLGEIAGDAIANALTLIDGVVAIGGGLAGASRHFMPALVRELRGRFRDVDRLALRAFDVDRDDELAELLRDRDVTVQVPGSARIVGYRPYKCVAVGVSRLRTGRAIALGAYRFAIDALRGLAPARYLGAASLVLVLLVACGRVTPVELVDPFVGTGGGRADTPISAGPGNTFPGAVVPWGMVSVSPHGDPHAPSGYRRGAPLLYGFGHVHLSGVGCPELGEVVVAATTGELAFDEAQRASPYRGEIARAGYYRVELARFGITVEATAARRAGLLRFRFPAGDANLLVDASHGSVPSRGGFVRVVSQQEIEGSVTAGGFCDQGNQHTLYFVVRASKPGMAGTWSAGRRATEARVDGTDVGAYVRLATGEDESIEVAVGVSYVDLAGARANLADLGAHAAFEDVRRRAERAWHDALDRVVVAGGTPDQQRTFYTALYHALLHPNVFGDVTGRYRSADGGVCTTAHERYTVYSLWDTYRTLHPLLSLVYPEVQRDMARTIVEIADESGWLPKWELAGGESGVMVGDPAMIVVADTYARGIRDFGVELAYPRLLAGAFTGDGNRNRPGHAAYLRDGFIAHDAEPTVFGSVSTTLEYALADAALATLADALGHPGDAERLTARSRGYRALFDPQTRVFRPRNADGSWLEPFDPGATCCDKPWPESGGPGFVEGSAWSYAFFALHDLDHLIAQHGGAAGFVARLDEHFAHHRFALGNEPEMSVPYLYAIAGRADRTAELVHALADQFRATPDGLPGNDDAGALSAWYVWAALGLYPAIPTDPRYWIGSPLFSRATLHLPGGDFTIVAERCGDCIYVQAAELDGKSLARPYLWHREIASGGTLRLRMGSRPGPPPWGPAR